MSDIIQLLPDAVANQIAAGEVIQRPASVIKELVENAVDAGATTINVIVVDAGRTSIQVIDDGKGMSPTDARLAFERHATSKIRAAEDLFALTTMGFRGEALPSVCSVSQVTLKTRTEDDELGTMLTLAGGKVMSQEPCSCGVGANFLVENLFYNVPARRKFLKSNSTELNNILTAFERIALVNPQIAFTLHSNGVEVFNLSRTNIRQRIVDVFGKRFNQELIPVKVETTLCSLSGFVGKPETARKKGAHQYFFVNDRYMKHPYFHKAVQQAYDRLVPTGEQVPYFLYFKVDPHDIDVNIHPTKTEIKFDNEQSIWQIVLAAVREAVGKYNNIPSIEFDTDGMPEIPVFNAGKTSNTVPATNINPQYNPFKSPHQSNAAPRDWQRLYEGVSPTSPSQSPTQENISQPDDSLFTSSVGTDNAASSSPADSVIDEKSPTHYQYKGQLIMTAVKSGLMIVDQHRAHVRILYERYLHMIRDHRFCSQTVLFPEVIRLSAPEEVVLEGIMDDLTAIGFSVTCLGGGDYTVSGVPGGMEGVASTELLRDIIAGAAETPASVKDQLYSSLALSMARKTAIPAGQVLSNEEMETVVNNLFSCSNYNYTPDGKLVMSIIQQRDLTNLLG